MLSKIIGSRRISLFNSWYRSGLMFTGCAATAFLYLTDWKVVVGYIPIYNTKFKDEEE